MKKLIKRKLKTKKVDFSVMYCYKNDCATPF